VVGEVRFIFREIGVLLSGVTFGCLFMPAVFWFLDINFGLLLIEYKSDSISTFYASIFRHLDDPQLWLWFFTPYLLLSLLRLLFRPRRLQIPPATGQEQLQSTHDEEKIRTLISQGGDVNIRNSKGLSPLHQTAIQGNVDLTRLLLEHGADADSQETGSSYTPLHYAAEIGQVALCEQLIRYGADPDALNAEHNTPLHLSILRGHPGVVSLLLKYSARLDIRNRKGQTPQQLAEALNHRDILNVINHHLSEAWPYLRMSRR